MPGFGCYDVPEPALVNADDVKIRVAYASICGSDVHTIKGDMDGYFGFRPGALSPLGHEASGVVGAVGPGGHGERAKIGIRSPITIIGTAASAHFCRNGQEQFCQNVLANGSAMSDFMVLSEQQVFELPDDADLAKASLVRRV